MGILFKPAALKSTLFYIFISGILTMVITDYAQETINMLGAWILAINTVLILAMAKDKASSMVKLGRTPEGTLLWLATSGGFPGLFLARFLFNHKTAKPEFIRPMWLLLALQVIAILYYIINYII